MIRLDQQGSNTAPAPVPAGVEPLARAAELRLGASGYRILTRVVCRACDGTLTLTGQVPSFYLKQVAQTLVGNMPDVRQVVNQLVVVSEGEDPEQTAWGDA